MDSVHNPPTRHLVAIFVTTAALATLLLPAQLGLALDCDTSEGLILRIQSVTIDGTSSEPQERYQALNWSLHTQGEDKLSVEVSDKDGSYLHSETFVR